MIRIRVRVPRYWKWLTYALMRMRVPSRTASVYSCQLTK